MESTGTKSTGNQMEKNNDTGYHFGGKSHTSGEQSSEKNQSLNIVGDGVDENFSTLRCENLSNDHHEQILHRSSPKPQSRWNVNRATHRQRTMKLSNNTSSSINDQHRHRQHIGDMETKDNNNLKVTTTVPNSKNKNISPNGQCVQHDTIASRDDMKEFIQVEDTANGNDVDNDSNSNLPLSSLYVPAPKVLANDIDYAKKNNMNRNCSDSTSDINNDNNDGASSACSSLTDLSVRSNDVVSSTGWTMTKPFQQLRKLRQQQQQQQQSSVGNENIKTPIRLFPITSVTGLNGGPPTHSTTNHTSLEHSKQQRQQQNASLIKRSDNSTVLGNISNDADGEDDVVIARSQRRSRIRNYHLEGFNSSLHRPTTATPLPPIQQAKNDGVVLGMRKRYSNEVVDHVIRDRQRNEDSSLNSNDTPTSRRELVAQVRSLDSLLDQEMSFSSAEGISVGAASTSSRNRRNDEDDGLTRELENLARSELLLRKELENCNQHPSTRHHDNLSFLGNKNDFSDSEADDEMELDLQLFSSNSEEFKIFEYQKHPSVFGSTDEDSATKDTNVATTCSTNRSTNNVAGDKCASRLVRHSASAASNHQDRTKPASPFLSGTSSDGTDSNNIDELAWPTSADESITPIPSESFETTASPIDSNAFRNSTALTPLDVPSPLSYMSDTVTPLASNRRQIIGSPKNKTSDNCNGLDTAKKSNLISDFFQKDNNLDVPNLRTAVAISKESVLKGCVSVSATTGVLLSSCETIELIANTTSNNESNLFIKSGEEVTIDFAPLPDVPNEKKALFGRRPKPSVSPIHQVKESTAQMESNTLTTIGKKHRDSTDPGDVKLFSMKLLKDNGTMTDNGDAKLTPLSRVVGKKIIPHHAKFGFRRELMRSLPSLFLPTPLRRTNSEPSSDMQQHDATATAPRLRFNANISESSSDASENYYFNFPRSVEVLEKLDGTHVEGIDYKNRLPRKGTPSKPFIKGTRSGTELGLHVDHRDTKTTQLAQVAVDAPTDTYYLKSLLGKQHSSNTSFQESESDLSDLKQAPEGTRLDFDDVDEANQLRCESYGDLPMSAPSRNAIENEDDGFRNMNEQAAFTPIAYVLPQSGPSASQNCSPNDDIEHGSSPDANAYRFFPSKYAIIPAPDGISGRKAVSLGDEVSSHGSVNCSIAEGPTSTISQLSVESSKAGSYNADQSIQKRHSDTTSTDPTGKQQICPGQFSSGLKWMLYIGCCLSLVVVVSVAVLLSTRRPGNIYPTSTQAMTSKPTAVATPIPTSAPSMEPFGTTSTPTSDNRDVYWSDPLFSFLVQVSPRNGTALRKFKYNSPQFKAYDWLSRNRFLSIYSDQQKVQRYVLATLYYSTRGYAWQNNENWLSNEDECMWYSQISNENTICGGSDAVDQTIIRLDLNSNNLHGLIPPEIALLSNSLQMIDFGGGPNKYIYGTIPSELGSLTQLASLSIDNNNMRGIMPSEILSLQTLQYCNVSNNDFVGTIPYTDSANVASLIELDLSNNDFSGTLPSFGKNNDALLKFSARNNIKVFGRIPKSWTYLSDSFEADLTGTNVND